MTTTVVRRAGAADADALAGLERDANLVALAHVYHPAAHPFPDTAVRERWVGLLDDPEVVVEVAEGPGGPLALLAHDAERVRHLAVHPDAWGHGLARDLLRRAVARIRAGGRTPRLQCLVDNHRARGLYEHLGWRPSGTRSRSEFAPHPEQLELVLPPDPGVGG